MLLKTTMIGRIGKNAEVRTSKIGKEFVTFSCATNIKSKGQEKTVWASCLMSGRTNLAPYLTKGQLVYVDGSQDLDLFNGEPQLKINVNEVRFLTPKKQDEQQEQSRQPSTVTNQISSDIPF